jgi:transcription-repair coupling factor (superfamily II helicase)
LVLGEVPSVNTDVFAAVSAAPAAQALRQRVEQGGLLLCSGVYASAQAFVAALLRRWFPHRAIVVVTDGLKTQETVHQDLTTWLSWLQASTEQLVQPDGSPAAVRGPAPLFYPAWEVLPHEPHLPHVDVIGERLETLMSLLRWGEEGGGAGHSGSRRAMSEPAWGTDQPPAPVIVTAVTALLQRTYSPQVLRARTRRLQVGDRCDPLDLVEWLEDQAYEPEAQVNHRGEIALRGGIVDVFPLTSPWPVRLEFFGDELESIRLFDPVSQLSRQEISSVLLPPGGELGILKRLASSSPGSMPLAPDTSPQQAGCRAVDSPEAALLATLAEHLPADTVWVLCEPDRLDEQAQAYAAQLPAEDPFHVSWTQFHRLLADRGATVLNLTEAAVLGAGPADAVESAVLNLGLESLEAFRPVSQRPPDPAVAEAQRREFFAQLHRWLRQGYLLQVVCNNEGEQQRFTEIWAEYGLGPIERQPAQSTGATGRCWSGDPGQGKPGGDTDAGGSWSGAGPVLVLGALSRGFRCDAARVVVVTDAEVFGRYRTQLPRRLKSPHAQTARSLLELDLAELQEGDYVVHVQHGIGRYLGLQRLPSASRPAAEGQAGSGTDGGEECLVIEYAPRRPGLPPPKLYVPVSEAHLVSKYIGAGKARPRLNTLGGTRWLKTKQRAEQAVRDLASELLAIQAARQALPGHAFSPDTPWQREFESAFLYEETPDQLRAIRETKADMEQPKPMDRLICGDAGYGKTEVALRAAFKAVMDGKQVAVLTPTTVLAQQHFNTFRERMADYPIRIELLSRFRSPGQQRQVVEGLAQGAVDIVIGTHRLLQDDIAFKDLGLVVIDEEHRFGVWHKEKLKQLRRLVDVLTLSATPIPRTLYLALAGARDMSTIETPPQDRLPIETIVCPYDERIIRDAILRELRRGGQVFYLHNRVADIQAVADRLRALVPEARIVVAHGQMRSTELERVMTQFVNGQADVLLSTTIVESGLDIPRANTILIDRADRFGLSDLYQLRGRVGRYKHQAYAYLLIPRHARMLTDARKRLAAIKQFSTPGSGFRIAMRDLEIRGAGNLLGPEQSGHITAVGFELYCQLLKQSIARLKGEQVRPRPQVQVRLDFISFGLGVAEPQPTRRPKRRAKQQEAKPEVWVPREVPLYVETDETVPDDTAQEATPVVPGVATLPPSYVPDTRQRVEVYRKLAEASDAADLQRLRAELRDRFGPLPPAVELLLGVTELKLVAAARDITVVETRGDRLMLTRNGEYIMPGGRFPRLTKRTAKARLLEMKRLVQTLP